MFVFLFIYSRLHLLLELVEANDVPVTFAVALGSQQVARLCDKVSGSKVVGGNFPPRSTITVCLPDCISECGEESKTGVALRVPVEQQSSDLLSYYYYILLYYLLYYYINKAFFHHKAP